MALMENYAETCRSRATNPEWPLELLKSIEGEFKKGIECGFMDPNYILTKIDALKRHTEWCAELASERFRAQLPEDDPDYTDDKCAHHDQRGCNCDDY